MNIATARVALRDRTLLDVFDLALRFVAAHVGAYAIVSACVSLPGFFLSWLAAEAGGRWLEWSVAIVLASFAEAPFVALASRLVFQERVPLREVSRAAFSALPRLVGARMLQAFGVAFGALFFLLPGVWLAALLLFSTEVIVLEGAAVGASLGRLQRLTSGYFGDVLGAMLLGWGIALLAIVLGDVAGRAILDGLLQIHLPASESGVGSPLALLGLWLSLPFLTTARFFVYLNLRTRREGWDIQTRFGALAARANAATAEEAA